MVRIVSHAVHLAPVPRAWLSGMVGMIAEVVEQSRTEGGRVLLPGGRALPDVSLLTGRHLRPGAVYDASDEEAKVRLVVREWDRGRGIRLEHTTTAPDGTVRLVGVLKDARRPRLVEVDGTARGEGARPWLLRVSGSARLDLDAWWAAAGTGAPARGGPARVRLDHRLARAQVTVAPRPAEGGWQVRVTVSVQGRWLLRPVVAVVARLARPWARRALVRSVDALAERWNEEVPKAVARGPLQWRAQMLREP